MKSVVDFLGQLASQWFDLQSASTHQDVWFSRNYALWIANARQTLEYAALDSLAAQFDQILEENGSPYYLIPKLGGILAHAQECVQKGFVGNIKYLLHAEMFDSMRGQAKGLLESGHKIPAAVLARIVIERWLRDVGQKNAVADWETAKASIINDQLKASQVFGLPKWRLIQSLLDTGNAAAHGKDSEFTEGEVKQMLDFIEANCL